MGGGGVGEICGAHGRERKCFAGFGCRHAKEIDRLEGLGVDGRIMLKLILQKITGSCGLDASGSGYESVAGCCEHRDEP